VRRDTPQCRRAGLRAKRQASNLAYRRTGGN
jgi:hypothetical protein